MFFPPQQPYQARPYHYQQPNFQQQPPQQHWQAPPSTQWMQGPPAPPPYQQGGFPGYQPQGQSQAPGMKLMSAFQTSDGKFDMQKAIQTMDLCVKTANQVTPLVKQVGSIFQQKS